VKIRGPYKAHGRPSWRLEHEWTTERLTLMRNGSWRYKVETGGWNGGYQDRLDEVSYVGDGEAARMLAEWCVPEDEWPRCLDGFRCAAGEPEVSS
jgi:hypothetical protein